jgi:integrase
MGLFKRGGKFWWGSYHDPRTKTFERKSTKCTDKEAARAVLREWERVASDPGYRAKDSTTLRVLIADYQAAKKLAGRAEGTRKAIFAHVRHIAKVIGDATIVRDISARDVDRYIAKRHDDGAKNATIAKELSTLRGMLKLAHRHEHCDHPAKVMPVDFDGASEPVTRKVDSLSDLGKLLDAMTDTMRKAHVLFLAATGADWGASLTARRADIDLKRGVVLVHGTKTDHRERHVPIVDLNRAMLERVYEVAPKVGPMFRRWDNPTRDLEVACRKAGIPRVTARDFRRSLGTWLRREGVESPMIGSVLGHADGRMAERVYGKLSPDDLRRLLAERLERAAVVRDSVARRESEEQEGLAEGLKNEASEVPRRRIELRTRGFSIQSKPTPNAGKAVRNVRIRLAGGTRLYVRKVRTMGELMDDALALGAVR